MFDIIPSASLVEFIKETIVWSVMGGFIFWREAILSVLNVDESKMMGPKVFSNDEVYPVSSKFS
jgi:hypothetical protein